MRTADLSPSTKQILNRAGEIADELMSSLENLCVHFDSEEAYLSAIYDYIELIRENPVEYLDFFEYDDSINISLFKTKIAELCALVQKSITERI